MDPRNKISCLACRHRGGLNFCIRSTQLRDYDHGVVQWRGLPMINIIIIIKYFQVVNVRVRNGVDLHQSYDCQAFTYWLSIWQLGLMTFIVVLMTVRYSFAGY